MYALVDANNFYVSCERLFRPDIARRPVVVLSNHDGCVIALSNEAKALGIKRGTPAFLMNSLFKEHHVVVFSSNYTFYGDMSQRVMYYLSQFCNDIEEYSIDEAFLHLNGYEAHIDLKQMGTDMRATVKRNTGIPISVGIGSTKSLAKVANKIAKKYPNETGGVYIINTEERRNKSLRWLPVDDIWGVGAQHELRLRKIGVTNALEFTQLSGEWIKKHMSIVGYRIQQELLGHSVLELEEVATRKNISCTRAFQTNYTEYEQLKERVNTYASVCAEKLRSQNSCCNAMTVMLETNKHRKDLAQYNPTICIPMEFPTNSTIAMVKQSEIALSKIFKQGYAYKKAGVIVMDLVPESVQQLKLFANENPKHMALMKAMDAVNHKLGNQKVKLGCQDLTRMWHMEQHHLSSRYTTRMDEVAVIKV